MAVALQTEDPLNVLPEGDVFLLLGSGASAGLGYPTMDELSALSVLGAPANDETATGEVSESIRDFLENIDLFLRTCRSESTGELGAAAGLEAVIERTNYYVRVLRQMATDRNFIRWLFPTIVQRSAAGTMLEVAEEVRELCYRALYDLYSRLDLPKECSVRSRLATVYQSLARTNGGKVDVFTTNYDMALQAIFPESDSRGLLVKEASLTGTDSKGRRGRATLSIYRLHGCVEWYWDESHKPMPFCFDGSHQPIGADGKPIPWSTMAVKVGSVSGEMDREPCKSSYRRLQRALAGRCNICVAVGVSFRDRELAHCIHDALLKSAACSGIVVVDKYLKLNVLKERLTRFPGARSNLLPPGRARIVSMPFDAPGAERAIMNEVTGLRQAK